MRPIVLSRRDAMLFPVLAAGFGLLGGLLLWSNDTIGIDGATYALLGDQLRSGGVPYRDIWEIKPPGLFALSEVSSLLGSLIGIGTTTAWRWVALLAVVMIGLCVVAILQLRGLRTPVAATAGVATVVLFAAPLFSDGGGLSEPPALAGALLAWQLIEKRQSLVAAIWAGLLLAVGISISLTAVPIAVFVLGRVVLWRQARVTLATVGGMMIGAAVVLAWLVASGSLGDAWRLVALFNREYTAFRCTSSDVAWPCAPSNAVGPWIALFLAIMFGLLSPVITRLAHPRQLGRHALLASFAVCLVVVSAPVVVGRPFAHYLWLPLLGIIFLSSSIIDDLWRPGAHRLDRLVRLPVTATIGASLLLLIGLRAVGFGASVNPPRPDLVAQLVNLEPGRPMLVWGSDARLYLLTDHPAAGGVLHLFPLMLPGYTTRGDVDKVCRAMAVERPLIFDPAGGIDLGGQLPRGVRPGWMQQIDRLLADHWTLHGSVNGGRIFVPRDHTVLGGCA